MTEPPPADPRLIGLGVSAEDRATERAVVKETAARRGHTLGEMNWQCLHCGMWAYIYQGHVLGEAVEWPCTPGPDTNPGVSPAS